MSVPPAPLAPTTRPLDPGLVKLLAKLEAGQRIRIHQIVRVGNVVWPITLAGTFRRVSALVTGLSTDRVPEDDVIVPTVHFLKDNEELSSITLDENTRIDLIVAEDRPRDATSAPPI